MFTLRVPLTPVPMEVGCPGPGHRQDRRTGLRRRGHEEASRGKAGRTGWGRSLAQLTYLFSAKPNRAAGEGGGGWDGRPGAESIPRPELVPSSGRTSEMGSVEGKRDGKRGSRPFPPAEPGRKRSGADRLGAAACAARAGPRTPGPQCPAHSKVSHCFLSCSTEPGAGAGLTSCLVFRSKSSKGSLAS